MSKNSHRDFLRNMAFFGIFFIGAIFLNLSKMYV
jgi:hypothetical protein